MVKINLKELKISSVSGKVSEIVDAREDVAETIYRRTAGLKFKLLAEKIYRSDVCEFDDGEWELFCKLVSVEAELFSCCLADAISKAIIKE